MLKVVEQRILSLNEFEKGYSKGYRLGENIDSKNEVYKALEEVYKK